MIPALCGMIPTLLCTASGLMIDLLHPCAAMIDFSDIAEQLAKEKRYNGATPGVEYSVAEHCCRGADALLTQGNTRAAAAFLIHDAPEAYLKDDTTPKKRAIAAICAEWLMPDVAEAVMRAFHELTMSFDAVIHDAAGLDWPLEHETEHVVHKMDRIMLATEWRDLMPPSVKCPFDNEPLPERILPWDWETARLAYLRRAKALLPALRESGQPVHAHDKTAREMGGASA